MAVLEITGTELERQGHHLILIGLMMIIVALQAVVTISNLI